MAHFARIDDNNIVVEVLVVPNSQEHRGQEYLADDLGLKGVWIQTSYNNRIRKNYAGVGYIYDEQRDAFISPRCHVEATVNEETCRWDCTNDEHNTTL